MKIHDATAGFMCYKREMLETIPLDKIKFTGYAFQIEMKYRAYAKNFKIIEVPIIFTDRTKGESKISFNPKYFFTYLHDVFEYIYLSFKIRLEKVNIK